MANNGGTSEGFLRFNKGPPKVRLTGEDEEPDPIFYDHLVEEGFEVSYIPYAGGGRAYRDVIRGLADDLELGENYALVAFGAAAAECLDLHAKPQPHLVALVAYYPTPSIPNPKAKYPPHLHVLCHIAGSQGFGAASCPSYTYRGAEPGFAEHDLEEYNAVAASLSWTRTLGVLRKAFNLELSSQLERTWEAHLTQQHGTRDALATIKTFVEDKPHVNFVPTMAGGVGQKDLFLFYRDHYFAGPQPPSLSLRLASRTIGVDRIVDELVISFTHTHAVPHILPGVPPTNKDVRIPAVSVATVRGGKMVHEHLYWDQASVLVQIGLLDPKLVPAPMKAKGMKRMPVYGAEIAAKLLDEESEPSNELVPGWQDRPRGDPGVQPSRPEPTAGNDAS